MVIDKITICPHVVTSYFTCTETSGELDTKSLELVKSVGITRR